MRWTTLRKTLGLGALTGLRKTPLGGNGIGAAPLAGRALMGAVAGGVVAYEGRDNVLLGCLLGASAAIVTAHLAFHARKRVPALMAGGALEDAVVIGLGSLVR